MYHKNGCVQAAHEALAHCVPKLGVTPHGFVELLGPCLVPKSENFSIL